MELSLIFKTLGDDNRLRIIDILKGGEKCACHILEELHIVQSTLSHHMKSLCESGLVDFRKEGKWIHYSLNKKMFDELMGYLKDISNASNELVNGCECN